MKIRFISDLHSALNMTYSPTEFVNIIKAKTPVDITLIAGDMSASINEAKSFLNTYFKDEKVVFINGNHCVYDENNIALSDIIKKYKKEFNGQWKFLENDYVWLNDDIAVIGCIGWTDYKYHSYKEFRTVLDEQGRRLDKKGNVLPEDPTKTEEFMNEFRAIWDDETATVDEKDKLMTDLYRSVTPGPSERVDTSFKNRVSEEVYNNYIGWQESFGKEAKKEFSQKEYTLLNKNHALRCMNDFRYGKVSDSKYNFLGGLRNLVPKDCEDMHKKSMKYIEKAYKEIITKNPNAIIILMTHHPFTKKCESMQYKSDPLNAAFISDHDKWLKQFPNIKYIHCGHVHQRFFEDLEDKKIICNPLGYIFNYEQLGDKPFDINYNIII